MSAWERLHAFARSKPHHGFTRDDAALVLAVIAAGSELDREYENPAPDYTMRNALRQRLHKSIAALTKD